jgi:DNA-binding NtrC family response regulator
MNILFIDDDKAAIRYYLEELREGGFTVKHCRNPDDAWNTLQEDGGNFRLIILDSAMPPGKRYIGSNTEEGLTTGSLLFEDISKVCPDVPVLILTNFAGLEWITRACASLKVREIRKLDVMPVELLEIVRKMIK